MDRCSINQLFLQLPTLSEWNLLLLGQIKQIDGYQVLQKQYLEMALGYAFHQGKAFSDKVIPVLELRKWARNSLLWTPSLIYWPSGKPIFEPNSKRVDDTYIQVYFRKFHCFDCELDIDAYAIENDAYFGKSYLELNTVLKLNNLPNDSCPRCNGNLRRPGIVEVVQVYDTA
ncbi:hypothetical protein [Paenibacillus hexagrammi]|uniref:Uncharacterized protein n=1 Tax=Paenibacillus hexagrammi TaxID=2908839 RepID=A0ABY3SRY8_9BACL|nr:hypothetical protein [Paenibacillus sp. YPD9-1]UJF35742.1 hypothetical protein L0M14_12000 [Paenibacillus sp. YPD9-1]